MSLIHRVVFVILVYGKLNYHKTHPYLEPKQGGGSPSVKRKWQVFAALRVIKMALRRYL